MEKFINKLKEIKNLLIPPPDGYRDFNHENFNILIERSIAIVEKKYGTGHIFSKRIESLKKESYFSIKPSQLENFKMVIDIIIDDLELSDKKQEEIIAPILLEKKSFEVAKERKSSNNNIFIVHGHNEAMKQTVARTIEKLELEPIILHEKTNQGQTIIEKFLNNSNVGFAIVLLSADDIGYSIKEGIKKEKKRARQNVIFELGYFTAKLGRKRVVALVDGKDDFELPSDLHGVIYILYDGNDGKWKFEVAKELMESGYNINLNRIL